KEGEPEAPVAPGPLPAPSAWLSGDDPAQEVRRLRAELATFQAREAVENLRARLRQVTESSAERWLRPTAALPEGQEALDLEAAIRAGEAVLFSVPVERNKLVGEKVGAWLLAEANRVASRLTDTDWGRKSGRRCLLLVDEFSGLQAQGRHVAGPINRIREGGVTLWLFTQSYADLNLLGDDTRDRIIGGTDVQIVFRQATTEGQEQFSRLFGEHDVTRLQARVDVRTGQPTGSVAPKTARVR